MTPEKSVRELQFQNDILDQMVKFAEVFTDSKIVQALSAQLMPDKNAFN